MHAYGVYLQGTGVGSAGCRLSLDASWLDATGTDGGVACTGGSLVSARFVSPVGGTFGASGVVDADGAVAPHVVVVPDAAATTKTTTTATTTTVVKASKPKTVAATSVSLPKTSDNNWIAASFTPLLLGLGLLGAAYRCWGVRHT